MIGAIYLTCFGLLFLTAMFLTFCWGKLAWRRSQELEGFQSLRHDRYMVLATALCIMSVGTGIMFGSRLVTTFLEGIPTVLVPGWPGISIVTGMAITLVAKFGFMWAIEMDKHDKWWVVFVFATAVWTLFAFWYELWYVIPG